MAERPTPTRRQVYGNVFEESLNDAGTSATVGDFALTPFGDVSISRIVDLFATTVSG